MSVRAELTVEDNIYQVRRYYANIHRDNDEKGRPNSEPTWTLHVVLDSLKDSTITNWMLDPKKLVDGKLTLYSLGDNSKFKVIEFKKSTCSLLMDFFNLEHSYITSYIAISGKDIKINTAELKQSWPGH